MSDAAEAGPGAKGADDKVVDDRAAERIRRGPLALELARFGVPLALGMGLQTTFNLVDAYIISRLEPGVASPALGAIGICDQVAALGTIVSYGLSIATAAIISRRQGERDAAGVRRTAWQSLLVIGALSVVFGGAALVGSTMVMRDVIGAKGEVASLGADYLRVLVGGSFTMFFLLHLTTVMRSLGSSKTPISMLLAANALNFVLAVLMVYGPGDAPDIFAWGPPVARAVGIPRMELQGAAWSTVIARITVLLPLAWLVQRRYSLFALPERLRPDSKVIRQIWNIGWPSSIQLVVRIAAMLLVQSLVARAYTTAADQTANTALGIVFRLETMALFVGLGWGSAAQTFVGQNLGADNRSRAKRSGWYAAAYNGLMMVLLALAYRQFSRPIVGFFDDDPRVLALAHDYLAIVGPSYPGLGVGIVLGAAIQGAGASRQTLVLDSLVVVLLQLPACALAVYAFDFGPDGLWTAVAATYAAFALVYLWAYRRGAFLEHRIS